MISTRSLRLALVLVGAGPTGFAQSPSPTTLPYCSIATSGTKVEITRPTSSEMPVDDVNWFARPVPNASHQWIVAFASHDQNYLYNLTTGTRVRIPDKSDAVATPDGRFVTVPSHYTATGTINFYDARTLLDHLEAGKDASATLPVFAHQDADVKDVYYQSTGVVSDRRDGDTRITTYRLMFSGSNAQPRPGFRVVDYEIREGSGSVKVTPTRSMRLCPEIVDDMATPFISKDGRYVVAHDRGTPGGPGTLKIFEITGTNPADQTTSCAARVDFGFAAGKADFSFDGSSLTFHISKHDYLTPFVNGGLKSPTITDVVVAKLEKDRSGAIVGHGGITRVTTTETEGTGSYFPAFLPDGRLFFISSLVPKEREGPKRFLFRVVDPSREIFMTNLFKDEPLRAAADAVGRLWQSTCAPTLTALKGEEAIWYFTSLSKSQCETLVRAHGADGTVPKGAMLAACGGQATFAP